MGTSKGYQAPTDPQWSKLKGDVTRSSRDGAASTGQAQGVLANFVATNGGARGMARGGGAIGGGRAGQAVGRRFGSFASAVSARGLDEALREVGLERFIGKSSGEIARTLVDVLCEDGSLLDEVDARNAMSDLMKELLEGTKTYAEVKQVLQEQLQANRLGEVLFRFFGHYLYHQFIRVFYERIIQRRGQQKAEKYFRSIQCFISSALKNKTINRDLTRVNWVGQEGARLVQQIHQQTLKVFAP